MTRVDWRQIVANAPADLEVSLLPPPFNPRRTGKRKLPAAERRAVAQAYASGAEPLLAICARFGIGPNTVRAYAQEAA